MLPSEMIEIRKAKFEDYLCKLISACTSYPFFKPPVYNALRCISSSML